MSWRGIESCSGEYAHEHLRRRFRGHGHGHGRGRGGDCCDYASLQMHWTGLNETWNVQRMEASGYGYEDDRWSCVDYGYVTKVPVGVRMTRS